MDEKAKFNVEELRVMRDIPFEQVWVLRKEAECAHEQLLQHSQNISSNLLDFLHLFVGANLFFSVLGPPLNHLLGRILLVAEAWDSLDLSSGHFSVFLLALLISDLILHPLLHPKPCDKGRMQE